ncbi:MAG: DNA polymerase I [Bacteroidales bacterium]|nr:DNA polymerase I [Bacteroidales bacterium]
MDKVFLLDAYTLIFRAYYAFIKNPRINSKKMNTSAIFGFCNSILDVLTNEKPQYMGVAFDSSAKTFRHDLYPAYKATREDTPEDIKKSVPYIKDILDALGINFFELPGYEADDILGTIAKKLKNNNYNIYLYTSDKDYFQLVDDKIYIYKPTGKGTSEVEVIDTEKAKSIFEVENIEQIIDVLSLWGDSSDNIPGAPGIGEKTSKKLIKQFGSIENLIKNANMLEGKLKESILNNKDKILLSKQLVTININVPIEINEEKLKIGTVNFNKLKEIFDELEFKNLYIRYQQWYNSLNSESVFATFTGNDQEKQEDSINSKFFTINDVQPHYQLLDSKEKIYQLISEIKQKKQFSFDTETGSLDIITPDLVGISFCTDINKAYYLPLPVNYNESVEILKPFSEIFQNNEIIKVAHNLKFDYQVLKSYGISIELPFHDSMIAHYLLEPEQKHNLDYLANVYLNYNPIPIESLIGDKKSKQISMRFVPLEKIMIYCCEDSDISFQLMKIFYNKLKENSLYELYEKVEIPLIKVIAEMELTGVSIDVEQLKQINKELSKEMVEIEQEIYRLAGTAFNINSPRQLGSILFEKLKIDDSPKTTKTKQYSTAENELIKYMDKHPIISKILEYRGIQKLISTYVEALPELINNKTKKVHTSFNQAGTATGRLSSQNPNLQNIPVKDEKGKEIRKAFIPSAGFDYILSADYSQIELRIMAHMSNDPSLIEAFKNNYDVHSATASKIFKVPFESVTQEMRKKAKIANFGIIYGISSFGLAERLRISRTEAKKLIDEYFENYPYVREYIDKQIAFARENGYVETILKRRRYLPDINSKNSVVRGYAERNAINTPIQGSASDIIKIAMVNIYNRLNSLGYKTKLLLQIHDELIFETTRNELNDIINLVRDEMENAYNLIVPLTVDIGYGKNWFEAH